MLNALKIRSSIAALVLAAVAIAGCASTTPSTHVTHLTAVGQHGTNDRVVSGENIGSGFVANSGNHEAVKVARAHAVFQHIRKGKVIWTGDAYNVKTTAGIDFTFSQTYGTGAQANGLNYIALSNDSLTETSASTTLSNEITTNGLARAQGTYAHTAGASTVTITKTFTCATAQQSAQKAALFSASSGGTMHHALSFTQRTLQVGDQLAVTFTITIS